MKRMVTEEDIKRIAEESVTPFDPSSLVGKYVKIIPAPESTTLTDEQKNDIINGVFMVGEFLGYTNPIFLPATHSVGTNVFGVIIGATNFTYYQIDANNVIKKAQTSVIQFYPITFNNSDITIKASNDLTIAATRYLNINGKRFAFYPLNQTGKRFHLTLDDGTMDWHEGNGLYLHVIVFDVGAGQSFTLRFISDSSTACELDNVTGNFTIPNAKFIQLANNGNVVVVPLDANKFAPDIHAFDSATGSFSDNITLASVTSDTVTPIG